MIYVLNYVFLLFFFINEKKYIYIYIYYNKYKKNVASIHATSAKVQAKAHSL